MSNLNESVKFDILRGWPFGGAVEESYKVAAAHLVPGAELKEGQLVELNASGEAIEAATANTVIDPSKAILYLVIQGNDQFDGKFTKKVVTLRGPLTIKTEKYTGAVAVGSPVTYSTGAGTKGYFTVGTNLTNNVGECIELDSTNGYIVVNINL